MIWAPWKRRAKVDPVGDAERTTDDLKLQLRELRELLLRETVEHARKVKTDDR